MMHGNTKLKKISFRSVIHILHMFVLQEETELHWLQRYAYNRLYSGTIEIFWCIENFFLGSSTKNIRMNYDCMQCSLLYSIISRNCVLGKQC